MEPAHIALPISKWCSTKWFGKLALIFQVLVWMFVYLVSCRPMQYYVIMSTSKLISVVYGAHNVIAWYGVVLCKMIRATFHFDIEDFMRCQVSDHFSMFV